MTELIMRNLYMCSAHLNSFLPPLHPFLFPPARFPSHLQKLFLHFSSCLPLSLFPFLPPYFLPIVFHFLLKKIFLLPMIYLLFCPFLIFWGFYLRETTWYLKLRICLICFLLDIMTHQLQMPLIYPFAWPNNTLLTHSLLRLQWFTNNSLHNSDCKLKWTRTDSNLPLRSTLDLTIELDSVFIRVDLQSKLWEEWTSWSEVLVFKQSHP